MIDGPREASTMRSLALVLALALQAAVSSHAGTVASRHPDDVTAAACDNPPCTKEDLVRYERRLIKRLQRANMLSAEARFRGEKETADRLHRTFQRNFDRRLAVRRAIDDPARD